MLPNSSLLRIYIHMYSQRDKREIMVLVITRKRVNSLEQRKKKYIYIHMYMYIFIIRLNHKLLVTRLIS